MKKLFTFFVAMIASITMMAQVTSSSMSGKVTDENGLLPGATVIATHVPSGTSYGTTTNSEGRYTLQGMRVGGPYTVIVRFVGYTPSKYENIILKLGETHRADFTLESETVGLSEVVISGDAVSNGMDSDRAGATTNISSEQIAMLPTVSRSLNDILSLTPQATLQGDYLSIGGGNYRQSYVTVDGAAFNNAFGKGSNLPANGSPVSLDAIEAMTINITPYDVRHSGFTGGAINAVTKSGTNEWHATVYDFFQNNNFKGYKIGDTQLNNSYSLNNTSGISVGGPIVKDKLFFFVNGEYSVDKLPGSTNVARTSADQAFGNNVAENRPLASKLDEMRDFLIKKFNYDPGTYQGFSSSTPDYKVLARLDWNINEKNTLALRFSHTHFYSVSNPSHSMNPLGTNDVTKYIYCGDTLSFNRKAAGRTSQYALPFSSALYNEEKNFMSVSAELNSRLTQRANNMFRFTWSHQNEPRSHQGGKNIFPTVDIMSQEGIDDPNSTAMYTTFGLDPFTYGNLCDVQTLIATDELSWSSGIHNMVGGLQFEWNRTKNGFMQGGAGWYLYNSWQDFVDDVENPETATGPALYMITVPNNSTLTQTFPSFDYSQASAYFQDEMSFSEFFKLTAGLRFEMPFITNPNPNFNKAFAEIAAANPESSLAGLSTDDLPSNSISIANFSPRLGFNWDILKNRKLILRGGTGLFTGRIPFVWIVSNMGNSNVLQYQYIAGTKIDQYDNVIEGQPTIHFTPTIEDQANAFNFETQELPAPNNAVILSKDLKMPSAWKSSLALDATLPGGIKGTIEGIYSYNFNEVYASKLNTKLAETGTLYPGEPEEREKWVSEGLNAGGYLLHNISNLHGYYYSVTGMLSKDFDFGLSLSAAYTYSSGKSVTDGNGDQASNLNSTVSRNGGNSPELGYSSFISPHRVLGNLSYQINEKNAATNIGLIYEGFNAGIYASSYASRASYLMGSNLIYIPTDSELAQMPFVDEANKEAFKSFIESDKYLSTHRGQYEERNAILAPWLNRINFHIGQEIMFYVAGKQNSIEIAADFKNIANLFNSNWGVYKNLDNYTILNYKDSKYTFTQPEWKNYSDLLSTWSAVLSLRYKF